MSESKRTTIGRYEIRGRLGKGGMAAVFKAYDPKFQREVAIKVLRSRYANDSRIIERFHREARAIAKLEHPAIVPIYDAGRDGDFVYIVMRYMPGGTLASKIRQSGQSGMAIEEIAAVIDRLGSALDTAHSQGIIHRDVKPANVLYDQYGQPFLADFGIAKLADSTGTLTVDNIIGTPAYMSPEQVNAEGTVDGRSDIYSLGTILYEMLSGEMPYQADTTMRVAMMHVMSPVPSITDVAPKRKKWQSVISKAMAKKAGKRYQTGREFSEAVMKTGRAQTTTFAAVDGGRRPYMYALAGAIGLIALASILGFFLLNRSQDARESQLANAQATQEAEFVSLGETREAQESAQAKVAAEFEATSTAFAIEAEEANVARELSVEQTVTAMSTSSTGTVVCIDQDDYDFEVGRIIFEPRLGATYTEGEDILEQILAKWTVENKGCPAQNVRLSTDKGETRIPIFTDAAGGAQGNVLLEGESVTMAVQLTDAEEANSINEMLTFVVENPNGDDLRLGNVEVIELSVPDDELWIQFATPVPPPTRIPTQVAEEPTERVVAAAPRATNTPRPRSTNTSIPPTRTPNYSATNTRQAEAARVSADATARILDATRTKQAQDAQNSQTREANNQKATGDAFNRNATATTEAQRAANAFSATETKRAQNNQANAASTRQAQTRQAEQNARNFQATQTKQAQNANATAARRKAEADGTATRRAQEAQGRNNGTATANAQKATQDAWNRFATQTKQAQERNVQATATANAWRPTNTPRPQPTQRPTNTPVSQSNNVTPRITGTSCVQGAGGFVNGTFRWTGQLGANQWFAIRIAPQGQAPQNTGTYVKNMITTEGTTNGSNWAITGFSTGLAPGEYSWTVALLDNGNPIAFAPQTGCFSNSGIEENPGGGTDPQPPAPTQDPRCIADPDGSNC